MKVLLASKAALVLVVGLLFSASSIALAIQDAPKMAQNHPQAQDKKVQKKRRNAKGGIPKGVQACVDRLVQIASADPLPTYEGRAEDIVNNGLLWDNPKSRCSIGSDQSLRSKVSSMATAWREKNAEKVRSLLQEIKSAAPQS